MARVTCPGCETPISLKVRPEDPPGALVVLTCPACGQRLRTRLPRAGANKAPAAIMDIDNLLDLAT